MPTLSYVPLKLWKTPGISSSQFLGTSDSDRKYLKEGIVLVSSIMKKQSLLFGENISK
jgi:hypothetical protein